MKTTTVNAEASGANNSLASSASLETMLGKHGFEAQGRLYSLFPIKLKDIPEATGKDRKFFVSGKDHSDGYFQFAFLENEQYRQTIDKWLRKQLCFDGQPVTYELAMDHDWDVDDLGRFLKEMTRLSG